MNTVLEGLEAKWVVVAPIVGIGRADAGEKSDGIRRYPGPAMGV